MSLGLSLLLNPLYTLLGSLPSELVQAIKRTGKRGNKTFYPTDLKRLTILLECTHDRTGKTLFVIVNDGNLEKGLSEMTRLVLLEDFSSTIRLLAAA